MYIYREEIMAEKLPIQWIEKFNQSMTTVYMDRKNKVLYNKSLLNGIGLMKTIGGISYGELLDITKTLQAAQQSKMYFENLIIHPIKIRLTFLPSPFPRSKHEDILSDEVFMSINVYECIWFCVYMYIYIYICRCIYNTCI
jgi:hypothetical protein